MYKLSRFFSILFILLSFITQSLGESGILYRITPPDIMGGLSIFFYILSKRGFNFGKYMSILFFLFALFVGGIIGRAFEKSMIEVIIHIFLFLNFIVIISHFKSEIGIRELIFYVACATILASVFGIYDMAASIVGLPRLFPSRAQGEVLSGFRNAGQAGAYALIMLSILVPAKVSLLFQAFSPNQKRIITFSIISGFFFLLVTGKMAAYIGMAIGLVIFFIYQRNSKALLFLLVFGSILYIVVESIDTIAPEVANRISYKYNTRLASTVDGTGSFLEEGEFISTNLKHAILAFTDNPLSGSGIGAFAGVYEKYEVHSTYFKIIGETGIIGILGYSSFMLYFFRKLRFRNTSTKLREYLYYLFPFILGCLVSWGYTYHMRKREFWIMLAIVTIINYLIEINLSNAKKSEEASDHMVKQRVNIKL